MDTKTGMKSFESSLWDLRIIWWLTIDPAREFHSTYLGMGNNPISTIDPDGRCTKCPKNAKVGDTFNHPDYGTVTYGKNGWRNDTFGGILDDVLISAPQSKFRVNKIIPGISKSILEPGYMDNAQIQLASWQEEKPS